MLVDDITLEERIKELVARHGSLRAVSRVTQIDAGYLSRLARGEKARPSKAVQRKLGVRAKLLYERAK